jgi:translation initiation factor IF-3
VNETIRAREVRVVFPDGETEVLPTHVGIERAKAMGLDLVVVSPTAVPPVAKVIDHGEYEYLEKKRKSEASASSIASRSSEVPSQHGHHDYEFKKITLMILEEGNKVKGTVFQGREGLTRIWAKLLMQFAKDSLTSVSKGGRAWKAVRCTCSLVLPRRSRKRKRPPRNRL